MKRPEGFDGHRQEAKPPPISPTPTRSKRPPALKNLRAVSRDRARLERREIRRFTKAARHRRVGWVVTMGAIVALVGILAIAVYSPMLALRTIRVEGTASVSAADVESAIDEQLGTPLALIDYDQIRSDLDAFPLIRSFVTEVQPPSTLVVRITERSPVGLIQSASGFLVVDPAGVVLSTSQARVPGLPLIGVGTQGTDGVAFRSVVEVLLALPASVLDRVDSARATSKDDVSLVLTGVGQRVVWGSAESSALKARVLEGLIGAEGENAKVEFDVSAPLNPVVRAI